jgi:hypothetical protein
VLLVTTEFVGPVSNGGIGTAYTTLAHSLQAAGHMVRLTLTYPSSVDPYLLTALSVAPPRELLESRSWVQSAGSNRVSCSIERDTELRFIISLPISARPMTLE